MKIFIISDLVPKVIKILSDIFTERERQQKQWGTEGDKHSDIFWSSVLAKQTGQASASIVESLTAPNPIFKADANRDIRREVVQIAAVAMAWLECIDER